MFIGLQKASPDPARMVLSSSCLFPFVKTSTFVCLLELSGHLLNFFVFFPLHTGAK